MKNGPQPILEESSHDQDGIFAESRAGVGDSLCRSADFQAIPAASQTLTKVSYAEVVQSVFYLPKCIALAKGRFRDEGLDVEMTMTCGDDKGTVQILDIVLQGPETAGYIENGASPEKTNPEYTLTAPPWYPAITHHPGAVSTRLGEDPAQAAIPG